MICLRPVAAAVVTAALLLGGCGGTVAARQSDGDFYSNAGMAVAVPGTLLRVEARGTAVADARSYRILY